VDTKCQCGNFKFYWFSKTLLQDTVDMKIQKPSSKDLQSILIPSMLKSPNCPLLFKINTAIFYAFPSSLSLTNMLKILISTTKREKVSEYIQKMTQQYWTQTKVLMERQRRMKKAVFTALDSSNIYIINSKFQTLAATIFHTLKCIKILCYRILFTSLWRI